MALDYATTKGQRQETLLPERLRSGELQKKVGTPGFVDDYWPRRHALRQLEGRERRNDKEEAERWAKYLGGRPVRHRR